MAEKTPNELYWSARVKEQIRGEYAQYFKEIESDNTPHNAHVFAMMRTLFDKTRQRFRRAERAPKG